MTHSALPATANLSNFVTSVAVSRPPGWSLGMVGGYANAWHFIDVAVNFLKLAVHCSPHASLGQRNAISVQSRQIPRLVGHVSRASAREYVKAEQTDTKCLRPSIHHQALRGSPPLLRLKLHHRLLKVRQCYSRCADSNILQINGIKPYISPCNHRFCIKFIAFALNMFVRLC